MVVNAETGSGKTLCEQLPYQSNSLPNLTSLSLTTHRRPTDLSCPPPAGSLLPVLQTLHELSAQREARLPAPLSLMLVPTPDLATQVWHRDNLLSDVSTRQELISLPATTHR